MSLVLLLELLNSWGYLPYSPIFRTLSLLAVANKPKIWLAQEIKRLDQL